MCQLHKEDLRKQQLNLCHCLKINLPDGLQIVIIKLLCAYDMAADYMFDTFIL